MPNQHKRLSELPTANSLLDADQLILTRNFHSSRVRADELRRRASTPAINEYIVDHTFSNSDISSIVELNNAAEIFLTLPSDDVVNPPVGTTLTLSQIGTGIAKVNTFPGVSLTFPATDLAEIKEQYGMAFLYKRGANSWGLDGYLEESGNVSGSITQVLPAITQIATGTASVPAITGSFGSNTWFAPAVDFPGTDGEYFNWQNSSAGLTDTSTLSLTFWIRRDSTGINQRIFRSGSIREQLSTAGSNTIGLVLANSSGTTVFNWTSSVDRVQANSEWIHVCGYVNLATANDYTFFIDGVQDANVAITFVTGGVIDHTASGIALGGVPTLGTQSLNGGLSLLAIWDRKIDWNVSANLELVRSSDGKALFIQNDGNIDGLGAADYVFNKTLPTAHVNDGDANDWQPATSGLAEVSGPEMFYKRQFLPAITQSGAGETNTVVQASTFDGAFDHLLNTNANVTLPDGNAWTLNTWVKFEGANDSTQTLVWVGTADEPQFRIERLSNNRLLVESRDPNNVTALNIVSSNIFTADNNWHHIIVSGTGSIANLYVNGLNETNLISNSDNVTRFGFDWFIGKSANTSANNYLNGCLAEFWFEDQDLNIFLLDNRNNFYNSSQHRAVNLGSNGSATTGITPEFYLKNKFNSFHQNNGLGNNFILFGALDECTGPGDYI